MDKIEYTLNQINNIIEMSLAGRGDVEVNLKELISKVLEEVRNGIEFTDDCTIDWALWTDTNHEDFVNGFNHERDEVLQLLDTIIKKYK